MARSTFPTAPPSPAGPVDINLPGIMVVKTGDFAETLPPAARARVIDLRQQLDDAATLARTAQDSREELRIVVLSHQGRIRHLQQRGAEGGYDLPEDAPQVADERKKLDKVEAEFRRISELAEIRSSRRKTLGALLHGIEQYLIGGMPAGTSLAEHAAVDVALKKGEASLTDAIENRRRRLRELRADAHRIESSPYPSAVAKARAREQIDALAERGCPSVGSLVEHNGEISFPTITVRSMVHNAGGGAVAFVEMPDAIGLLAWLHRDVLVKRLDAEIDECSDDKAAMTTQEREVALATITSDMLAVEREECALIDMAQRQGIDIAYRPETSTLALLGLQLVTAPASTSSGSSAAMLGALLSTLGAR